MKRNFDEQILDLNGQVIRIGTSPEALARILGQFLPRFPAELRKEMDEAMEKEALMPLTLGAVCVTVLMTPYQDERALDMPTRVKRAELARKINAGGVVDVTIDDLTLINPLLVKGAYGGPLVPVAAAELLAKDAPAVVD